jgi:serine/threonine protein kinase
MSTNGSNGEPDGATRAATPHGFTALKSGTRLDGRYTIEAVLAAGGFGITYVARHDGLGRVFAIKEHFPRQFAYRDGTTSEVRPTDPGTFKWALDRFLLEGRALARCKHPNVVDVTDVFEGNRTAYMVLVYEDGQSLKSWLDSLGRPPTQAEIDGVVGPLLEALEFVHAQDLLHRDIAPDNIMVRRDGKPCLIDFGAARQAIAQRSQVISAIVKTGFSPPEQYTTTGRAQGPWTDIYALGATLYRAVTAKVPPESTDRQIEDDLVPVAEAVADPSAYRAGFLAGIDRALRLRQAERPQSIAEWRQVLFSETAPAEAAAPAASSGEPARPAAAAAAGTPVSTPPRASSAPAASAGRPVSAPAAAPAASFSSLPSPAATAPGRGGASAGLGSPAMLAIIAGVVAAVGVGSWIVSRPAPSSQSASTATVPAPGPSLTREQQALIDARLKAQQAAEKERGAQEQQQRLLAERQQKELLAARQKAQEDAAREAAARRDAEAAAARQQPAAPDLGKALKALEPLTDKDKQRFARTFESRHKALERSRRNAKGDQKSLAAIEAAEKLVGAPSVTTNPDQLVGRWTCRSISLGGSLGDGNPQFAADIGGTFQCTIARDGRGLVFRKLTGSMKKLARLDQLPVDGGFLLYYGTTIAQSDKQPTYPGGDDYGHEVGLLVQLGADRLRLELSEPNHSASAGHEVIELIRSR